MDIRTNLYRFEFWSGLSGYSEVESLLYRHFGNEYNHQVITEDLALHMLEELKRLQAEFFAAHKRCTKGRDFKLEIADRYGDYKVIALAPRQGTAEIRLFPITKILYWDGVEEGEITIPTIPE